MTVLLVCLLQYILKHLLFGKGLAIRLLGLQYVLSPVCLSGLSLLLVRLISVKCLSDVVLHLIGLGMMSDLILSLLTLSLAFLVRVGTDRPIVAFDGQGCLRFPIDQARPMLSSNQASRQVCIHLHGSEPLVSVLLLLELLEKGCRCLFLLRHIGLVIVLCLMMKVIEPLDVKGSLIAHHFTLRLCSPLLL
jgi:hypothetical protein